MAFRYRTYIILTLTVVSIIVFAIHARTSRLAAWRSTSKANLSMSLRWAVDYTENNGPLMRIHSTNVENRNHLATSWRTVLLIQASQFDEYINDVMKEYNTFEAWNSKGNTECARKLSREGYNYFKGDGSPLFAKVVAVTGEDTAWPYDTAEQTEIFQPHLRDKLAFAIIPASSIYVFSPIEITRDQLEDLIQEHGEIHAIRADGQMEIFRK